MSTSRIFIQTAGKSFSIDVPEEKADAQFLSVCNFIMECNKVTESRTEAAKKPGFRSKKLVYPSRKNVNQKGETPPDKTSSAIPQQETAKGEKTQPEPSTEKTTTISEEQPLSFDFASKEDGANDTVNKSDKEMYGGFLHIVCEQCGRPFSFSAKMPLSEFECHECGHKTPLRNLAQMKLACECGKVWRYHTNALSRLVELNCIACGSPMIAEMDKHGDYYPLKE